MIKIEHVTKYFEDYPVLNDLSLTVPTGSIYGLMGLNGAGKTTLLRHLSGFLRQNSGSITIDGQDITDNEALKRQVLFIPDELFFFRGYSMTEMSRYYRKLYPRWNEARFEEMTRDFGLDPKANIGKFSKGMKKQAAFCLAMAAMPDYLLLDGACGRSGPHRAPQAAPLSDGRRRRPRNDRTGILAQCQGNGGYLQLHRYSGKRQDGL